MSNITLTAGVRQNLLSLQQTASLLGTTQQRLATGKKVNTAFDNPQSYFASQSLTNRANDLSALLDQIGQAQQTLDAANQGLTSITSLLESALSTAQQAQQAAGPASTTYGAINVTGTIGNSYADHIAQSTGTVNLASTIGTAASSNLVISTGTASYTATLAATDTLANVESLINAQTGGVVTATDDGSGHIKLTASDSNFNFTITDGSASEALGLTTNANVTVNGTSLFSLLSSVGSVAQGDTLTVGVNGGATQDIVFGTGTGQIQTLKQLGAALAGLSGASSATASGSTVNIQVASASSLNSLTIGTSGSSNAAHILTALGLSAGTTNGTATAGGPSTTRQTLQSNFDAILTQIDQLAGDSSYNGVNLLNGNNLKVDFNENATSSLTIAGVTFNSAGLGLSQVTGTGFQVDSNITATINQINSALTTVRAQTETFGTNSSTIQTRQDFTKNLINTLQTGSDNLVLADQNAESANLLTLQTRQQLSISALSISNQASQAVLKLFP